jgi:hypothetical protein
MHCIHTDGCTNLLDLIFSNLSDLCITPVNPGLIKPEYFHPPLYIKIPLPFVICAQNYIYSYRNYTSGDYTLLYNIVSTYDWSSVYGTTCVDSTVTNLNTAVCGAMEQAIPRVITNSGTKFPHWYS